MQVWSWGVVVEAPVTSLVSSSEWCFALPRPPHTENSMKYLVKVAQECGLRVDCPFIRCHDVRRRAFDMYLESRPLIVQRTSVFLR